MSQATANDTSSGRLRPDDWAARALEAMSEGGLGAVAVEPIARDLGVTKGSFYHHFNNRDELVAAALERWERLGMKAIQREAGDQSPRQRLESLFVTAFDISGPRGLLMTHLCAAADHPLVGPVLARVTEQRLAAIAGLFTSLGMDADTARRRAMVSYTAYLGMYQVRAAAPDAVPGPDDLRRYVHDLVGQLV